MHVHNNHQFPLTGPEIIEVHEMLTLAREIAGHQNVVNAFENPVAGLQIIPKHEYDKAKVELEVAERKLAEKLDKATENVGNAYKCALGYLPVVE